MRRFTGAQTAMRDGGAPAGLPGVGDHVFPEPRFETMSEPERKLRLGVLERAILDYQLAARSAQAIRLHADMERWFTSPDRSWPFSYRSLCDVLGFDPGWLWKLVQGSSRGGRVHRTTFDVRAVPRGLSARTLPRRNQGNQPRETRLSSFVRGLRRGG